MSNATEVLLDLDMSPEEQAHRLLRFLRVDPDARFVCGQGCEHPAIEFVTAAFKHAHADAARATQKFRLPIPMGHA